MAPPYLEELVHPVQSQRNVRSQDSMLLYVPKARPFYGERAFQYAAPFNWNKLDKDIKTASTLTTFKTKLKTHLLGQQKQA